MTIDEFIAHLDNPKQTGRGWKANCPICGDRKGHLSASEGDEGRILLRCFHGCKTEDIMGALGLRMADLFSSAEPSGNGHSQERLPSKAKLPPKDPITWLAAYCGVGMEFLKTLPLEADGDCVAFTFGRLAVRKLRPAGSKSFDWDPAGGPNPPLWPLPGDAVPSTIYVTEGESDCIVARYIGLDAYALTRGAGVVLTPAQATDLSRRGVRRVVLLLDIDKAGEEGVPKQTEPLIGAGLDVVNVHLVEAGIVDP